MEMNFEMLWQIFNIVLIVALVILIVVLAKMLKEYVQKQSRKFWKNHNKF